MRAFLPEKFAVYPKLLAESGYRVGLHGKGYGPTKPGSGSNPAGPAYGSFGEFLRKTPPDKPFCFWFGSHRPHRPYSPGGWRESGRRELQDAVVPPFLPDAPEVRSDLLDYFSNIEAFDREATEILQVLDSAGMRDNTIVVMTSDNGMAFPRGKCNLYDAGVRMPLVVRWPANAKGGRTIDDFICFTDFAPTFLEAAGVKPPAGTTGRSFLGLLMSGRSGRIDPARSRIVVGRERHSPTRPHALGYPSRMLRTHDLLYIRNFHPERPPTGDPAGSADVDDSPSKAFMLANRDKPEVRRLFQRAFEKRPAEELYELSSDPWQMRNVAADPKFGETARRLAKELEDHLRKTGDPRVTADGDVFDRYPFWGAGWRPAQR